MEFNKINSHGSVQRQNQNKMDGLAIGCLRVCSVRVCVCVSLSSLFYIGDAIHATPHIDYRLNNK